MILPWVRKIQQHYSHALQGAKPNCRMLLCGAVSSFLHRSIKGCRVCLGVSRKVQGRAVSSYSRDGDQQI